MREGPMKTWWMDPPNLLGHGSAYIDMAMFSASNVYGVLGRLTDPLLYVKCFVPCVQTPVQNFHHPLKALIRSASLEKRRFCEWGEGGELLPYTSFSLLYHEFVYPMRFRMDEMTGVKHCKPSPPLRSVFVIFLLCP